MHRGRVLAVGTPEDLRERRHADTLEDAFVAYLEEAESNGAAPPVPSPATRPTGSIQARDAGEAPRQHRSGAAAHLGLCPARVHRTGARQAAARLRHLRADRAAAGGGLGVSFDVENVRFTVLDRDQSLASRELLEQFAGSLFRAGGQCTR
jgi:ribosome-dependent ATPase